MNDQSAPRADRSLKIISEENPRDCRKRMRFAFSSRVAAGVRYLRSRISFALSHFVFRRRKARNEFLAHALRLEILADARGAILARQLARALLGEALLRELVLLLSTPKAGPPGPPKIPRAATACSRVPGGCAPGARAAVTPAPGAPPRCRTALSQPRLRVGSCSTLLSSTAASAAATGLSTPAFSRIFASISCAIAGFSLRNSRQLSLPWPSRSPL